MVRLSVLIVELRWHGVYQVPLLPGMPCLEWDVEKGVVEREPIGGRHALSTLPRINDRNRPERGVDPGSCVGLAVPALWRDDGLRD